MCRCFLLATALGLLVPMATAAQDEPRDSLRSRFRQRVQALPGIRGRVVPGAPLEARPSPVLIDDTEASGLKPDAVARDAPRIAVADPIGQRCVVQLALGQISSPGKPQGSGYEGVLAAIDPDWIVLVLGDGESRVWLSRRYVVSILVLPDASPAPGEKERPGGSADPPKQAAPARSDS